MFRPKEGFIYRRIAGEHVVIPIHSSIADFNGLIAVKLYGNTVLEVAFMEAKGQLNNQLLIGRTRKGLMLKTIVCRGVLMRMRTFCALHRNHTASTSSISSTLTSRCILPLSNHARR